MADNLDRIFQKFFHERSKNLFDRFPGMYRARVEETNDPLILRRIRVRIPELHNADLQPDDLPWATPAFPSGGKGDGSYVNFCIGDFVWVQFEKGHPYGPVWVGAATPTRRKMYPLESVYGKTPLAVNDQGQPADSPDDFDPQYLPKDGRPMSMGMRDRYGTFFLMSSVGFFPIEHKNPPAPAGTDAVSQSDFQASKQSPQTNQPDVKYAVFNTKYGHTMVLNDVGYEWENEFKGDFNADASYEIARQKYLVDFFNEGAPSGRDQRRIEMRTRYGNKFEMRDVGFQKGRPGEYQDQKTISNGSDDQRWVKLRTKAGMLIESMDHGCDPEKDLEVKKLLKTDKGSDTDHEDSDDFKEDARQIRLVTRHGNKIVLDDRGSDVTDAENKEEPRGNGILIKTRRGYGIDMNDKDPADRIMMYTPKSKVLDMNDRFDYVMMCTDTTGKVPEDFKGKKGNEFAKTVSLTHNPEKDTFHMKLDKQNKYARLKTPEGQGLESRDMPSGSDSSSGCPKGFTQMTGPDDRGLFMSRDNDLSIWRSKDMQEYIALDDNTHMILIRNNHDKIQIFAAGNIEVISQGSIDLKANQRVSIKAGQEIAMEAGGSQFVVRAGEVGTNTTLKCDHLSSVTMGGTHVEIQIPCDPCGPASPEEATSCVVDDPSDVDIPPDERKPQPFDQGEGCAPNKSGAGPIPPGAITGGSGGFGGSGSNITVNPPEQATDPLSPSGGVLWYGTTDRFRNEAFSAGMVLTSFINNNNTPPNTNAPFFTLAQDIPTAQTAAAIAQQMYGGLMMILRIDTVPVPSLLQYIPGTPTAQYSGDIPPQDFELYHIDPTPAKAPPQFPNI
jgi:hypothetical protein